MSNTLTRPPQEELAALVESGQAFANQVRAVTYKLNGDAYSSTVSALNQFDADLRRTRATLADESPPPSAHVMAGKAEAFERIVAARKKHVDAVAAYNARRELANAERMRGSWAIKLDEEYRAMSDAQSEFHRIVQDACDADLAATSEGGE